MDEIKEKIIQTMENVGIYVAEDIEAASLTKYFDDSLQFMSFIVQLEETFEIEFTNEVLVFEKFDSIDGIHEIVLQLKKRRSIMTVEEALSGLKKLAGKDRTAAERLLATRDMKNPVSAFCAARKRLTRAT